MPEFVKVAKASELSPSEGKAFEVQGKKIAVFNIEGTYYAIDDTCTHRGGPLSEGMVEDTTVTCPWHGAKFQLKSGESTPPAPVGVSCYNVRLSGDDIEIEV